MSATATGQFSLLLYSQFSYLEEKGQQNEEERMQYVLRSVCYFIANLYINLILILENSVNVKLKYLYCINDNYVPVMVLY